MLSLRKYLAILASVAYVISPLDVVPDFIPGLGWLDDLFVIGALIWYLRSHPDGRFSRDFFRRRVGGPFTRHQDTPRPDDPPADFSRTDPYTLLEVSPHASPEEIKAAYRRAVSRYHPDKVAHLGEEFQDLAHRKFLAIQRAYERLQGADR
jgi:DnaJ-domain-containing protein 1